jgi:bifunctional UDP-N-acetylglucosamine pyrophosphorylase/glucosamine-1-phosphate N-acetyltransferase
MSRASPPALAVVVLAAGKGRRFAGAVPKVLVECLGVPILEHVRRAVAPLEPRATVLVVGHGREAVEAWAKKAWPGARPVVQDPPSGTGHAVRLALAAVAEGTAKDVVVVCGDVPQIDAEDLRLLLDEHRSRGAAATMLTGRAGDPGRLGRVLRHDDGRFRTVVEAADATPQELGTTEFNTGVYAFDLERLRRAVERLPRDNAQREEYLPDALPRIAKEGGRVEAVPARDGGALLGVNTPSDLALASLAIRRRIVTRHLEAGVHVVDPETTVIEVDVEIAPGARILPFTYLGHGCRVGPRCVVGPFAHLRGGTVLEEGVQVGNFVEVKASVLHREVRAKHLAYLGDAEVGEAANVGCGAITANYDGKAKHRTFIGARARIGSGTVLVAPVSVGEGAVTGANAVVVARRDVPPGAVVAGVPAKALPARAPGAAAGSKAPAEPVAKAAAGKDLPAKAIVTVVPPRRAARGGPREKKPPRA